MILLTFSMCRVMIECGKDNLQGRVRVPTGGIAHEHLCMMRCDSEADSTVWMKEDENLVCYAINV